MICVIVCDCALPRTAPAGRGDKWWDWLPVSTDVTTVDVVTRRSRAAAKIHDLLIIIKRTKPSGAQNRKRKKEDEEKKAKSKATSSNVNVVDVSRRVESCLQNSLVR